MNTKVTIAGVELKNPVMTASGTFGSQRPEAACSMPSVSRIRELMCL